MLDWEKVSELTIDFLLVDLWSIMIFKNMLKMYPVNYQKKKNQE